MPKPSVAILHYSCPPIIGGVEFVIQAHARLFADAGYPTRIIVGAGGKLHPKARTIVIPELASRGGPLDRALASLRKGKAPASFEKDVRTVEDKLRLALKGVDVCMMHNVLTMHFNLILNAALANIMKKGCGTRFIGWTHDAMFNDPNYSDHQIREYPWTLMAEPLPGCQYCVISMPRRREVARLFKTPQSQLPIIPDGVDTIAMLGLTKPIAEFYRKKELYRADAIALTATRIVRRKNIEEGIEIVAALKKKGIHISWMITGAPDPHNADAMEYFRKLTNLRRKLGVKKEVMFLCEEINGAISFEDLRGLYALADMMFFPSKQEGFGIPMLEGGLFGLLLVVNDIPALRALGGKDVIYIQPGKTPSSIAGEIIKSMKTNTQLAFRKKVLTEYSWEAVFEDKIQPAILKPRTVWKKK